MADEISSIIEEINEELKNDQLLMFFKKYRNAVFAVISASVVGILAYSSWYARKMRQREDITNALLNELHFSRHKDSKIMDGLIENAPSELIPILIIIKSGKKLSSAKDISKAEALLSLTKKHGVDIVWKDLAMIIYVSYGLEPFDKLIELLKPLTANGRPFQFTAMELLAMNYRSIGDHEKAHECLSKIVENHEAPMTLKKRVLMLLDYMKDNSEKE